MRRTAATLMAMVLVVAQPVWAASPFPQWPATTRAAEFSPAQDDPVARRCDLLANPRSDPQRVGDGVMFESTNVAEALPACEQAGRAIVLPKPGAVR